MIKVKLFLDESEECSRARETLLSIQEIGKIEVEGFPSDVAGKPVVSCNGNWHYGIDEIKELQKELSSNP